jgi:hypothetical protein
MDSIDVVLLWVVEILLLLLITGVIWFGIAFRRRIYEALYLIGLDVEAKKGKPKEVRIPVVREEYTVPMTMYPEQRESEGR